MTRELLHGPLALPPHWRAPTPPLSEWVGWVGRVSSEVIGRLTRRSTRVAETEARVRHSVAGRFWLRIAIADDPASSGGRIRLTIAIDAGAARAILDGLLAQLMGFRSDGQLLDTDHAALEYVALEVVDTVLQRGGFASVATIEAFGLGDCPAVSAQSDCCSMRISVGPLAGEVHAFIEHAGDEPLPTLPLRARMSVDVSSASLPSSIKIDLRAPFVLLGRDDWEALATGDLVLAGGRSFEGLGRGMHLTTESGWTICGARVSRHHAREFEVEALDPCIEPDDPPLMADGRDPESGGDICCLRPLIGSCRLPPTDYERLFRAEDRPLRISLEGGSGESVRLCRRERVVATAEIVRHDDDLLAYRIISLLGGPRDVARIGQGGGG